MRRPSAALLLSGAALVVAVAALVVALRDGEPAGGEPGTPDRPAGLWRALPAEGDLPEGWHVTMANVGVYAGDASAQIAGPERLSGYLTLMQHEDGAEGAQLLLRDIRESADVLPGRKREQIGRLGNEAVAVHQTYQPAGPAGADGPQIQNVTVVWRRGAVVVYLTVQDFGTYLGPGRTQPSTSIEMTTVEALARAIDARLARDLR
jgi:hypothetical protein